MAFSEKVTLLQSVWNDDAARLLAGAAGYDAVYTMADLQREIEVGSATLFQVVQGGSPIGYVVLWVDDFGGTKELVLQAGEAFQNHDQAVAATLPVLIEYAKRQGCMSIRAHTAAKRHLRALKKAGFRAVETVVKIGV